MSCGADTEAEALFTTLLSGEDITLPVIDLDDPNFDIPADSNTGIFAPITKLTNADLTTGTVAGSGTFDTLMKGFKAHLQDEYDTGRITGGDYAKTYVELTQAAMQNAVQFLLGRDQAYWSAVTAQLQARVATTQVVIAKMQLATAKAEYVNAANEAFTAKATYALTKLKLATESENFCIAKFQLEQMLPSQKKLVDEQIETQRSQTTGTRSDGSAVAGTVGKQIALYDQQITSYKRDAEVKAAKLFTDAWITQKTIDEGLDPPDGFTNDSLDTILTALKTNNDLN